MSSMPLNSTVINPALRQVVIFAGVGVVATATHAIAALSANQYLNYPPLTANLFGYACAFMISYLGNARLTFKKQVRNGRQFVRFMVISLVTLAFNQASIFIFTEVLDLKFSMALVPTIILVPIFSFVTSKLWAFSDRRSNIKVDT